MPNTPQMTLNEYTETLFFFFCFFPVFVFSFKGAFFKLIVTL